VLATDARDAPRQSEIAAAVARLASKDYGTLVVVERLAGCMSRETFLRVLEKFERRRSKGGIDDDAAYLVEVLQIRAHEEQRQRALATAEAAAKAVAAAPTQLGVVERARRGDPAEYIAKMAAVPDFDVEAYLLAYIPDEATRERLRRGVAA
jgi:hypothetical protein